MFVQRRRFYLAYLMLTVLFLAGCQSIHPKGLNAQQVAMLKQQGFELTDDGWAFDLSGKVLFGSDLETLNAQSSATVERIGKALLSVDIQRVRVDGHTDNSGKPAYNEQLSLRRAESVAKVLIAVGMRADHIQLPIPRSWIWYAGRPYPTARYGQSQTGVLERHRSGPYREPPGGDCSGV